MRCVCVWIGLLFAVACSEQAEPDNGITTTPTINLGSGGTVSAATAGDAGGMSALTFDAGTSGAGGSAPRMDASVTPEAGTDAAIDGGADNDRCNVGVHDPAHPPQALEVTGDLGTHDPALIAHEGVFYLWQTGPRLPGKISTDLMQWSAAPSAFGASNPAWVNTQVPGATDLWAPDVSYFGDPASIRRSGACPLHSSIARARSTTRFRGRRA